MSRKVRSYDADDIVVEYDATRCIHAAECVAGLPEVFDATRRPWIDPKLAPADKVARTVERCPTGALRFHIPPTASAAIAPEEATSNSITIDPDGPLFVSGRLNIHLPSGDVAEEARVALCRCGHSKNKPYCDRSHTAAGFSDPGHFLDVRLKKVDTECDGTLEIRPIPNGPLLFQGPVWVRSAGGDEDAGTGGALCRCGQSAAKPFCDGTHNSVDFVAE